MAYKFRHGGTVFHKISKRPARRVNRPLIVEILWRPARIYPNGRLANSSRDERASRTAVDRYSYGEIRPPRGTGLRSRSRTNGHFPATFRTFLVPRIALLYRCRDL